MRTHPYEAETRSLLTRLSASGFKLTAANDGMEDWIKLVDDQALAIDQAIDILTSVDESYLEIQKDGLTFRMFLVYGNNPGELVCDYSWPIEAELTPLVDELDKLTDNHFNEWIKY